MTSRKKFQFRFRFQNLLIWLFLYLVLSPMLEGLPHTGLLFQLLFSAVLLSAVYTINQKDHLARPAIVLLTISVLLIWINAFALISISNIAIDVLVALYLGLMVYAFGRYIFTARRIDTELICAALCLYFLIGLLWAAVLMLLQECVPGSFAGSGLNGVLSLRKEFHYFNYLSFVTLTTLGYGDITPQTPAAMALCQVEAILGQFFITVLVARLVGIQVAQELTCDRIETTKSRD